MPADPLPEVRILATADAATPYLLHELQRLWQTTPAGLLSLATGGTFAPFLRQLAPLLERHPAALLTHLDEYLGHAPSTPGGMVHELQQHCPPLATLAAAGRFLPVPCADDPALLAAHEARLAACGGVALQLLGIGRNGHLAFNEPGTPWSLGFHGTTLADSTRQDAAARFAPLPVPTRAVTAGIASILAARRLVLCAFGANKAAAVAAMLLGEVAPACPASALRQHPNVLVLLDTAAANTWLAAREASS
jgi:glucosamine-6-phosphate deaminase